MTAVADVNPTVTGIDIKSIKTPTKYKKLIENETCMELFYEYLGHPLVVFVENS